MNDVLFGVSLVSVYCVILLISRSKINPEIGVNL